MDGTEQISEIKAEAQVIYTDTVLLGASANSQSQIKTCDVGALVTAN